MLDSPKTYASFIYGLQEQFPIIQALRLVFYTTSRYEGRLKGRVEFQGDLYLDVVEVINFAQARILSYGYVVRKGEEILYWYDSQPHPHDVTLASTHPHHKHIHPNIKRNRVPAPDLSFEQPNLPFLIREIEQLLLASKG